MAFKFSFDKYMEDVYSQLECNASNEYEKMYITFTYSKEEVENNIEMNLEVNQQHLRH